MNVLDIVLGVFLLIGLFQGFRKGFFVELASLLGLILGVIGAIYFSHFVSGILIKFTGWEEQTVNLVSFAITFIGIVILVSMLAKVLTQMADIAALGLINKFFGAVFGLLSSAFFMSVLLLFFNSFERDFSILEEEKKETSILYKPVSSLAPMVLPKLIKELNEYIEPAD
jgi:membrane protein required for colicin V production